MSDRRAGRLILFGLALPVMAIAALLTVRLLVTVMATASTNWLDEFVPLGAKDHSAVAVNTAVSAARRIRDPNVAGTLMTACGPDRPAGTCLDVVSYGLGASPGSGELWLARATYLAGAGTFDDRLVRSLANSYRLAPFEGWIAASRLPLALRVRSFLSPEMADDVGRDVAMVVKSRTLAAPLIQAYIADPLFRDATWPVIEQYASFDEQERLIGWIRGAL